jgi:hypothetical protein
VPVPDFGSAVHTTFIDGNVRQSIGLISAKARASNALGVMDALPPEVVPRGEADPRHVPVVVGGRGKPGGIFLADTPLVTSVIERSTGAPLTHAQLGYLALANTVNAVRPEFTPGAINDINRVYFTSPIAFRPEAGLANAFSEGVATNAMLGVLLSEETGLRGQRVRIKELCSGQRTGHWATVADMMGLDGIPGIDLTVSDMTAPPIDELQQPDSRVTAASEVYNWHDDLPHVPEDERFDAVVTTYADSVWVEGDMRLTRMKGQWYQSFYRVKVDDWSPRQQELLQALRGGTPMASENAADYEGMFVEEVMVAVAIDNHPWKHILDELPEARQVNIPTGLVMRIAQAFERQLTDGGVFICGDVADTTYPQSAPAASSVSGVAERYKIENWQFARQVLERVYGLHVEFETMLELAERVLPPGISEYTGDELINAGSLTFMKVRRSAPKE